MKYVWIVGGLSLAALTIYGALSVVGAGAFKRMVTVSGIYSVCRPDKYDVVCFLDADGGNGGVFCMPLSVASTNGECKK